MKLTNGELKGTTSLLKRSTVKGMNAVGEQVKVACVKSKKKYYA